MTPFGKLLRQERRDKGITLAEMADGLGISSPYLSQMETGGKPITGGVLEKAIKYLELGATDAEALRRAAARSTSREVEAVSIRLPSAATARDREIATAFALNFHRWKPEFKNRLKEMLEDVDRG